MGGGKTTASGEKTVRIVLLRSAIEDLVRGREFYEKQGEGLGDYFEEALAADIESLRLFVQVFTRWRMDTHRMLSSRFPYAVYYDVVGDQVRVRAILDCRRNPQWIRSRLRH